MFDGLMNGLRNLEHCCFVCRHITLSDYTQQIVGGGGGKVRLGVRRESLTLGWDNLELVKHPVNR